MPPAAHPTWRHSVHLPPIRDTHRSPHLQHSVLTSFDSPSTPVRAGRCTPAQLLNPSKTHSRVPPFASRGLGPVKDACPARGAARMCGPKPRAPSEPRANATLLEASPLEVLPLQLQQPPPTPSSHKQTRPFLHAPRQHLPLPQAAAVRTNVTPRPSLHTPAQPLAVRSPTLPPPSPPLLCLAQPTPSLPAVRSSLFPCVSPPDPHCAAHAKVRYCTATVNAGLLLAGRPRRRQLLEHGTGAGLDLLEVLGLRGCGGWDGVGGDGGRTTGGGKGRAAGVGGHMD